jgi:hypothetical protein
MVFFFFLTQLFTLVRLKFFIARLFFDINEVAKCSEDEFEGWNIFFVAVSFNKKINQLAKDCIFIDHFLDHCIMFEKLFCTINGFSKYDMLSLDFFCQLA